MQFSKMFEEQIKVFINTSSNGTIKIFYKMYYYVSNNFLLKDISNKNLMNLMDSC